MKICGISCFCNIFHLVCVCVACQSEFHHTKGISTTQHHTATLTDKDAGETAQSLSPQKKTLRQGKGGLGRAKRALANKIYVHRLLLSKQKVRRAAHIHTHTHTHLLVEHWNIRTNTFISGIKTRAKKNIVSWSVYGCCSKRHCEGTRVKESERWIRRGNQRKKREGEMIQLRVLPAKLNLINDCSVCLVVLNYLPGNGKRSIQKNGNVFFSMGNDLSRSTVSRFTADEGVVEQR